MQLAGPEVLVCDTSFISHFENSRRKPARYSHWPVPTLDRIAAAIVSITPFTLAEIRAGYIYAGWGAARIAALENRLSGYVLIPLDDPALDEYANLQARCRTQGITVGHNDLWIAAIAISQGLELVTCDRQQANLPGLRAIHLPPP